MQAISVEETRLFQERSRILKALAHPTRLWMATQLQQGERCVCEFVDAVDADFSTISKHLSVLRRAGIVDYEKRGKEVYYHLKVPCLLNSLACVETVLAGDSKNQNEKSPAPSQEAVLSE